MDFALMQFHKLVADRQTQTGPLCFSCEEGGKDFVKYLGWNAWSGIGNIYPHIFDIVPDGQ
jgi:hypothetical protein